MKKYTIAEILHLAADKHLASKEEQGWNRGGNKEKFSCCAVENAIWELWNEDKIETLQERDELYYRTLDGLAAMGCPTSSTTAFDNDENFNAKNQQTRYAWLKFAAMIAEEQGV